MRDGLRKRNVYIIHTTQIYTKPTTTSMGKDKYANAKITMWSRQGSLEGENEP